MSVWSVLGILAVVLGCNLAATKAFSIDPSRIYTPDDFEELRVAAAYEKCRKTPGCDTSLFDFPHPRGKCQEGAGADEIMNRIGVRTGGPTAVSCNSLAGEVVWPATKQCVKLLSRGPCKNSEWVQLSRQDLTPICAPRPCGSQNNAVMMNGVCQPMNQPSTSSPAVTCPPTQQLISNEFGEGECDCEPGTVFYRGTHMCYTPYTQGPCIDGYIIKVLDSGVKGEANCVPNTCPKPNMVRLDQNCQPQDSGDKTSCHDINTQGPCETGVLRIDNTIAEPLCITTHSIFSSIGPRCPRGSLRDARGRCRINLAELIRTAPPFVTSRPRPHRGNGHCPPGQVFMAGICLMIRSP